MMFSMLTGSSLATSLPASLPILRRATTPSLRSCYSCHESRELMLAPIMFAPRLERELTRIRKSGKVGWLRPDAKSQVSVIYEDGKPIGISCVVVSTQHAKDVKHSEIRSFIIEEVIKKVLPNEMLSDD